MQASCASHGTHDAQHAWHACHAMHGMQASSLHRMHDDAHMMHASGDNDACMMHEMHASHLLHHACDACFRMPLRDMLPHASCIRYARVVCVTHSSPSHTYISCMPLVHPFGMREACRMRVHAGDEGVLPTLLTPLIHHISACLSHAFSMQREACRCAMMRESDGCYPPLHHPLTPTYHASLCMPSACERHVRWCVRGVRVSSTQHSVVHYLNTFSDSQMHTKRALSRARFTFFCTKKGLSERFFSIGKGTPCAFCQSSFFSIEMCQFQVFWAFMSIYLSLLKIR